MYVWQQRDRLAPMHMVWLDRNHNDYKFELRKWHVPGFPAWPREIRARLRVEHDRETRYRFPGISGQWPLTMKKRKKSRVGMQVAKAAAL